MTERNYNNQTKQDNLKDDLQDDLPQAITESYGTGVKNLPGYNLGERNLKEQRQQHTESSPEFSAEYSIISDEIDDYWQETVGDEAAGGTVPTPDQNVTEEIEAAIGLEMNDFASLRTNDILEQRDTQRWELDPMSSDDYSERKEQD
ncbi:MAG TPA: DUF6335 family protein [Nostocaceae cyanobacterium]|nr:DUF6335 family protein [Nostocaceae cyanobacterium]